MFDGFREECGVFGIYGHPDAANLTYLGLYALQHRGQEAAGIVSSDGKELFSQKAMGLVADIFTEERIKKLPGNAAIGHNRYSTTGDSSAINIQPILVNFALGGLAIAHNGNLVNAGILKDELEAYGSIFQSTMDSEVIIHLIAQSRMASLHERIVDALGHVQGSYSLVLITEKEIIAVRDPHGFRPLALGEVDGAAVVASETCAFDLIEATYVRDVEPGEMIVINKDGIHSSFPFKHAEPSHCIFEFIYFARPDSKVFGQNVYAIRKAFGRQLAKESAVSADVVIPVPDSGVPAALGYAEEAGLPFDTGLIRNHYVGRTFIEPRQSIRHFGVKIKLNPVADALRGKRVVVVDDSIVRGTTSKKIIKMIRNAGAAEVHLRISSPPTMYPCYYGIDTPTRQELIAASHNVEEIRRYVTADSLSYISLEGVKQVVNFPINYCVACFDGAYPVPFPGELMAQLGLFDKK
ncbi:MAG: amidophosphoribosyltransferase [Nitrospirae bacterium GWC2_57_13]|jgi:amidophosphoribosyltransferase|nr:MAG: amidophosphoribosyltransferase [Nitrospirae bacterium GWC2_57_13]